MAWVFPADTAVNIINNATSDTDTLAVTTGDLIVVCVSGFKRTNFVVPSSITDSAGNTYTLRASKINTAGPDGCALYTAPAGTTVTVTITITLAAASYVAWQAWAVQGHNASTPFSVAYDAIASFSSTALQVESGASNPVNALGVAILSLGADIANTAITNSGANTIGTYTQVGVYNNAAAIVGASFDRQVLTVPATQRIHWTFNATSEGGAGVLAFLNPASGDVNDVIGSASLPTVDAVVVSPTSMAFPSTSSATLTITVTDQFNLPIENATVTVTPNPAGIVTAGALSATNSSGVTTSLISGVSGGAATLSVVCGSVTTVVLVNVTAGGGSIPLLMRMFR